MTLFISCLLSIMFIVSVLLCLMPKLGKEFGIGLYVASLISAIVIAGKLGVVEIAGTEVVLSASIIVFAATFLITDAISEIYGKETARKAIWAGLAAYPILYLSIYYAVYMQPEAFFDSSGKQASFEITMQSTSRVILASVLAFIAGQLHDIWAFHYWKNKTQGKHLWLRNNLSTWGSQLIDTTVFYTVAFAGVFPILELIIVTYLIKILIAGLDTVFLYAVIGYTKRANK